MKSVFGSHSSFHPLVACHPSLRGAPAPSPLCTVLESGRPRPLPRNLSEEPCTPRVDGAPRIRRLSHGIRALRIQREQDSRGPASLSLRLVGETDSQRGKAGGFRSWCMPDRNINHAVKGGCILPSSLCRESQIKSCRFSRSPLVSCRGVGCVPDGVEVPAGSWAVPRGPGVWEPLAGTSRSPCSERPSPF